MNFLFILLLICRQDYLIEGILPFHHVEQPEFQKLIHSFSPTLVIKCRNTFVTKVGLKYLERKSELIEELAITKYVCTTADCWTSRRKHFIGFTIHWVGEEDLIRRSCCLALRRLRGSVTFDVLAKTIDVIHNEFGVSKKVTATITDNGSNFVKAFRIYGWEEEEESEDEDDGEGEEDDDMEFMDVANILDKRPALDRFVTYTLPRHRRCASHTLNLVATTDILKISDQKFTKLRNSAEKKIQQIWNKQSRSSQASDFIEKTLGVLFKVKNATRWNSFYDALYRYQNIKEEKRDALYQVFDYFKVVRLTSAEEEYVAEYLRIMEPVADALEILQGERNVSMGYLLPTIVVLKRTLDELKKDKAIVHCKPLLTAVYNGVCTRFDHFFYDNDLRVAALSHPRFKMTWVPDDEIDTAVRLLKNEMLSLRGAVTPQDPICQLQAEATETVANGRKRKKDFFSPLQQ